MFALCDCGFMHNDQAPGADSNTPPSSSDGGNRDSGNRFSRTPWVGLLVAGLLIGTILGHLMDDMAAGTAYGFVGAVFVGAFWAYFGPKLAWLMRKDIGTRQ